MKPKYRYEAALSPHGDALRDIGGNFDADDVANVTERLPPWGARMARTRSAR
jgi:hypothetical protein